MWQVLKALTILFTICPGLQQLIFSLIFSQEEKYSIFFSLLFSQAEKKLVSTKNNFKNNFKPFK